MNGTSSTATAPADAPRARITPARVLLVGLIAGGIWTFLSIGLLSLAGGHLLASIPGSRVSASGPGPVGLVLIVLNVAIAIWATWLCAALRPGFGAGPRTALVTLPAALVTMLAARWIYER